MEKLVTDVARYLITVIQKSPLDIKSYDIAVIKAKLIPIFTTTWEKLQSKDTTKILNFVKAQPVLERCILPNVAKILSDGQINLNDIPEFLNIIIGVYQSISEFVSTSGAVSINSNDIIEIVGLLIKSVIAIIVADQSQLGLAFTLIDSATKMIILTVKPRSCGGKLCVCCKGA